MKKIIFIFFCSIIISSCSTPSTTVSFDVPPQNIKRIITPLQVNKFSSSRTNNGRKLAEQVRSDLLEAGYIKIVKSNGQGTLRGNLDIDRSIESTTSESRKNKKGSYTVYFAKKKTTGRVSYSLVDRQGNTLSSGVFKTQESDSSSSRSSGSDARSSLPTDDEHQNSIIETLSERITAAISPTKRSVNVKLKTGDHPGFKYGIKYLKGGLLPQALNAWMEVVQESKNKEEKASAYYNMGVAYESKQSYKQAYDMFKKADKETPANDDVIQSLVRLRNIKKKQNTIKALRRY